MENQMNKKKKISTNINLKILAIAILFLAFLLPKFAILNLVGERQYMEDNAVRQVAQQYGSDIIISTPKIAVPYKALKTNVQTGNTYEEHKLIFIEANECTADIKAPVETLKKGIYHVPVCQSTSEVQYTFVPIDFTEIDFDKENFIWKDALLFVQLNDSRGVVETPVLNMNSKKSQIIPGVGFPNEYNINGFHTKLDDYQGGEIKGDLAVSLKGTNGVFFNSSALNFDLNISSNWPHPNFQGQNANYAPHSRDVTENGFYCYLEIK